MAATWWKNCFHSFLRFFIVWPWLEPDVAGEAKVWFWRGHDTSGPGLGKCRFLNAGRLCKRDMYSMSEKALFLAMHMFDKSWETALTTPCQNAFVGICESRTCQSTWRSSQCLVWLALHLDMLAMRCQHAACLHACPWIQWVGRSMWQEGGQLTEPVRRRPYCVLLFDEMEQLGRKRWIWGADEMDPSKTHSAYLRVHGQVNTVRAFNLTIHCATYIRRTEIDCTTYHH